MSLLTSSRLTRRLIKLASLGLAGLVAGLLSGCTASPAEAPSPRISSDWEFTSSTTPNPHLSNRLQSIDSRQIPALHHPPSTRRLQAGESTPLPIRYSNRS